jgi:phenylacetate-coenzyme A ligase PaaK-like adenylate-forming protein
MNSWLSLQRRPRAAQRALQDELLRHFVCEYLYPFSPYYRDLFDKNGVRPEQIRTADDLRRVPLSTKKDLLPTADEPQRFKRFILQPDPASIRAAWPLAKKLPLLWTKWTRGSSRKRRRASSAARCRSTAT